MLADTREFRRSDEGSDEVVLLLSRSDYLLDAPSSTLLQVELNTIASSFGCLGDAASRMHASLAGRRGWGIDGAAVDGDGERRSSPSSRFLLPANGAAAALAGGLAAAFAEVVAGAQRNGKEGRGDGDPICLFVVQPGEKNAYDQALLAEALWENHGVRSVRATLRDVAERGELRCGDDEDAEGTAADGGEEKRRRRRRRPLYLDGRRVAVAYLRSGYAPTDYPTELEWRAREVLEGSDAALCPSVALQLAGAKRVQQALAAPGATERFLRRGDGGGGESEENGDAARRVRAHFAGLWGLDGSSSTPEEEEQTRAANAALAAAVARPEKFVLKPQREGGGNNLYGEQLRSKIKECGSVAGEALAGYILMQRILPSTHEAVLVRAGAAKRVAAVSELGIFGVHLRRGKETLLNVRGGHLLRTKPADADEGGVASGFAVLDSPMLVDE